MSTIQKNNLHYAWICDYASNSGEGNLARLFVKKKLEKYPVKIITSQDLFKKKFLINFFSHKYISPFIGIIYCWVIFIKGKEKAYINYLPLWNFLIFLFLPPKTLLGPITGGANYKKNKKQYFIRKFFFPILYKISELFLNLRNCEIIFSTNLLRDYLSKKTIKKSKFNFIFNYYKKNHKYSKTVDFLIYHRKHLNKNNFFSYNLIKKIKNSGFKIHVIGDKLKMSGVKNYEKISNSKLINLLKKTRYTISSDENLYNIFSLECINNHVKIITDVSNRKKITHFKKSFIFINLSNNESLNFLKKNL
jgi:hypothetical protein